jgi:hypothetical protein
MPKYRMIRTRAERASGRAFLQRRTTGRGHLFIGVEVVLWTVRVKPRALMRLAMQIAGHFRARPNASLSEARRGFPHGFVQTYLNFGRSMSQGMGARPRQNCPRREAWRGGQRGEFMERPLPSPWRVSRAVGRPVLPVAQRVRRHGLRGERRCRGHAVARGDPWQQALGARGRGRACGQPECNRSA